MANRVRDGREALARHVQIGSIDHPLGRDVPRCARCEDSGHVWIVCPDAGAVKVPCECQTGGSASHRLALADLGAAAMFAGGCAALLMLL